MGYAHEPEFSTAGFFRLPDTGRDVYSMNPAWRFYKGSAVGAEAKEFNDKAWHIPDLVSQFTLQHLVNVNGLLYALAHFTYDTNHMQKYDNFFKNINI